MAAYYNEIDPYCCAWLSNLMDAGHITPGKIDDRSIASLRPSDFTGYERVHFFAGIGGWDYALNLAGWGNPVWRPVWTGSCPCQPFSQAGSQRSSDDARHLWPAWFRLIQSSKPSPSVIFGEQVEGVGGLAWLDHAASDLEACGYSVGSVSMPSHIFGAPHRRQRLWFVAHTERDEQSRQESRFGKARRVGRVQQSVPWDTTWQDSLARVRALDDGIPRCVEATDAARNAIVPQVAAAFVSAYMEVAC